MKRVLHLVVLLFISINLLAQAPQKMSYQAVIRNASNNLVTNAPVKMRISILQGSAAGTSVYSELHNPTTNANGLVSIEIGEGTNKTGTFSSINWGNGTYFLKTETDPNNGSTYSIVGTSQLLSVPYALESKSAGDGIKGVSSTGDTVFLNNGKKYIIPGIKDLNPPSTINNGLVAFYPFNGNANDESGNGNNGVVNGATLTTDRQGSPNKAYSFDGINDLINIPFTSTLHGSIGTINAWVKVNGTLNTQKNIISQSLGRPQLVVGSQGINTTGNSRKAAIQWKAINGQFPGAQSNTDVDNGQWLMITGFYSLNTFKIYINGVLENSFTTSLSQDNCSNLAFQIGGFNTTANSCGGVQGFSQMLNGIIDDIRIYNRELTQEEITYLYNN